MLLKAARAPCWRPAARFAHPSFAGPSPWTRLNKTQLRAFTCTSQLRNKGPDSKDLPAAKNNPIPTPAPPASQLIDAKAIEKPDGTVKAVTKKDLLSESTKATKEQRKADWAILREMAKYLWPKVWLLMARAWLEMKVLTPYRMIGARSFVWDQHYHYS